MNSVTQSWTTCSPRETEKVGTTLVALLGGKATLYLDGPLAAGKTVLARGIAEGLGIPGGEVHSPSYTLVHEHFGERGDLVHMDLYRLESEEVVHLGIEELLERSAVKVIEWPSRMPMEVPGAYLVEIEILSTTERQITLQLAP